MKAAAIFLLRLAEWSGEVWEVRVNREVASYFKLK